MHAIVVSRNGGPEVLEYTEVPTPKPKPGELLVEVAAAGVNYMDTYQRNGVGSYGKALPFTPGAEFAGTVAAIGEGANGFAVGDRVASAEGVSGAYAQFVTVDARRALRVPAGLDDELAAAVLLQGLTAHYLAVSTWPLRDGETALVHAAAGGVGLLLTQVAKSRGARVIGTVSSAEKEAAAREAGADEVVRYTEVDDLAAAVRGLTGGRGVDVVYDGVGATTFEASLASLRPRGLLALYGAAGGQVPPFDPQRLNALGSLFLTRPTLRDHTATEAELEWRAGEVFDAVASGALKVTVGARYPLEQAAAAHGALESRATSGKVLLIP